MKKPAQNFCSRETDGTKRFVCCHFKVYCYRFWGYSWSLLFKQAKNTIIHSLRFVLGCSVYKEEQYDFDWPMRVSCTTDNQVGQQQMYGHKTNRRSCSVYPDSFETQTCKTRSGYLPRERRLLSSVSRGVHRLDRYLPDMRAYVAPSAARMFF